MTLARFPWIGFLRLFLPAVAVIAAAGWFYTHSEIRNQRHHLESGDRDMAQLATLALRQHLRNIVSDIEFLANMPDLRRSVNAPTKGNTDLVAAHFAAYMDAHGQYDQLRWIGQDGRERLRLNLVDGRAVRVPEAELQDKSARPYFAAARQLPPGGIFVSPLDLNIEHGRIEFPHKPVIRLATPLFDDGNHLRGVLVINYLGKPMLDAFAQAGGDRQRRLMLLNRHGYWIRGPRTEDEWGFMLGRPTTLGSRHPQAWRAIRSKNQGQTYLADGLWTWESLSPVQEIHRGDLMDATVASVIRGSDAYAWHTVVRTDAGAIAAVRDRVWSTFGNFMAGLVLVAALVSAWAARSRAQIERLNLDLAERVEAAEAASQAKAGFLANMSHEIRTPMNAILGLAYLLEKTRLPGDANTLVRKIRLAGRSLQGIINDILDFSKIEAGRLEIEQAPFHLGDVLDNLSTIMANNAGDKDIELVIAPPPAGAEHLVGDALRLEQILINLTGNGIKFTDQGYVHVDIALEEATEREVTLRFTVRDTGIGISDAQQQDIFTPFTQADVSTTRRFGGTGLGLSITRRLVAMMGGEMGLTSSPGQGSTFWFRLSFGRAEGIRYSAPEMVHLDVLIADDNPVVLETLRQTAQSLGWRPHVVDSGEAAVQHFLSRQDEHGPREVLILDWKMPGMDGLSAAREIHEAVKGDHEPIIIMITAHDREQLLDAPDCHLADAVLQKPVTGSSLYQAVASAQRGRMGEGSFTAQPPDMENLPGLRMLVVDDSEINREVAQRIFNAEGAQVALANNGREALEWLGAHGDDVDVVLMDVQMPEMDGFEATRRIRATPSLARLPVVALTAGAFKTHQEAALAAGMNDFIAKPFDVAVAVEQIRKVTGWRMRRPAQTPPPHSPDAQTPAPGDLPGLAIGRALTLWRDPDKYRRFLRKFAHDHADWVEELAGMETAEAKALAHKVKGAAGSLGLDQVATLAGEAETGLRGGTPPPDGYEGLRQAWSTALQSIDRYAPEPPSPEKPPSGPDRLDRERIGQLLDRATAALGTDNPDHVEPLLDELERVLPSERLTTLRAAVEDFDFRGGEAAVRSLAEQLAIPLES